MSRPVLPTSSSPDAKKASSPFFTTSRRTWLAIVIVAAIGAHLSATVVTLPRSLLQFAPVTPPSNVTTTTVSWSLARAEAAKSASTWIAHLRSHSPSGNVSTTRVGCREYDAGAQSCVYEGLVCVNATTEKEFGRPTIYFVDDSRPDGEPVRTDNWCGLRAQSADPRYFSSRHWPIMQDTFAPQRSCLSAEFRTLDGLLRRRGGGGAADVGRARIKWFDSLWLVDLDYVNNNHNNHLVKDILWLLDVALWQQSVDVRPRPDEPAGEGRGEELRGPAHLFSEGARHVYLPQGEADFVTQTSRDVNRLTYALILQLDVGRLYPNLTQAELHAGSTEARAAAPLLEAFPELREEERLVFHKEMREDEATDLVCTRRFTAGAKIGNGGHERVCRHLRQEAYALYGVKEPVVVRVGQIRFPQPPKRIVLLQRHVTRPIENIGELESALRERYEPDGVEVEVVGTDKLRTAEEFVRVFARAGVLITPHGSQSMGQIWMPRHSALIEIMPVGYTDYAFSLLADSCKIWYYEVQSLMHAKKSEEYYDKECGKKTGQLLDPCTTVKSVGVTVDVEEVLGTVRFALGRLGYAVGSWAEYGRRGGDGAEAEAEKAGEGGGESAGGSGKKGSGGQKGSGGEKESE